MDSSCLAASHRTSSGMPRSADGDNDTCKTSNRNCKGLLTYAWHNARNDDDASFAVLGHARPPTLHPAAGGAVIFVKKEMLWELCVVRRK